MYKFLSIFASLSTLGVPLGLSGDVSEADSALGPPPYIDVRRRADQCAGLLIAGIWGVTRNGCSDLAVAVYG